MSGISFSGSETRLPEHSPTHLTAEQAHSAAALFVDAALIIIVSVASGIIYQQTTDQHADISALLATGVITAVLFCSFLRLRGLGSRHADITGASRAWAAATVWTVTFLFLILLAFGLKIDSQFPHGAIALFYAAGMATVCISRSTVPQLLTRWMFTKAQRGTEIVIVAPRTDERTARLRNALAYQGCQYFRVIDCDDRIENIADLMSECRKTVQAVYDAARVAAPGPIYVLAGKLSPQLLNNFLMPLRLIPRPVYLIPDEHLSTLLSQVVKTVGDMSVVEMQRTPLSRVERIIKRSIDIIAATAGIFFCLPFLITIALAIKLDSPGPIFFRQQRHGYRGQLFRIVKFRSMTVLEDGNNVTQAKRNDSRVTRLGSFLREWSLDELPQLWNVLCGDMSLIGPRPHAMAHDKIYSQLIENYEIRQHVRPGITGWAQIHGLRGETPNIDSMYRRIELDIWYATNCTVVLDLLILIRTVVEVLRRRNAY